MAYAHPPRRSIAVSGTLKLDDVSVAQRVSALEAKFKSTEAGADKGKLTWVADILKSLVPSAVLAVIGYFLNDTVNRALKEHELQIEVVKDMQSLAGELQKSDIQRTEAAAAAARLATYGKYAVPFLIDVREVGNEYGSQGAVEGLRMVARTEPRAVCDQLGAVIRNRTGLYSWQTHLAALQLIGETHCTSAAASVADYRAHLTSVEVLQKWVGPPAPEQSEFDKVSAEAASAVARVNQVVPSPPSEWFRREP